MLLRLIAIGIPVCLVFAASIVSFTKEKSAMALAQLVGAMFLLVVVFAHISEAFGFVASMGWGQPNSLGHYIDLASLVAGAILLPIGYFGRRFIRRRNSK